MQYRLHTKTNKKAMLAEKPHDAVVKFDTDRNYRRNGARYTVAPRLTTEEY